MYYKGGCGVVPPAGVCPGKMIVKFRGWPRDMDMCRCFPPDPSLWLGRDGVRNTLSPEMSVASAPAGQSYKQKDLLDFSKSLNSYWVRESNPYCKIENLEY